MSSIVKCVCHQIEWESTEEMAIHQEAYYRQRLAAAEDRHQRLLATQARMEGQLADHHGNPLSLQERMADNTRQVDELKTRERGLQRQEKCLVYRLITLRLKEARLEAREEQLRLASPPQ